MPPAVADKALHALASSEPGEGTRRQIQRLAEAPSQATNLFTYGLPAFAQGQKAALMPSPG